MSTVLITIVTLLYACIAISTTAEGNAPMGLVYGAYALGNAGMLWGTYR